MARRKCYRVVAKRGRKRAVMAPGPLTRKEARTVVSKISRYPGRHIVVERTRCD